ncbi:MAG: anthranilate synthase component I [Pseudobutyrivibrio sp.]|nr:anthranilate synthase component I [Pseudobutyrivibrio sp.]
MYQGSFEEVKSYASSYRYVPIYDEILSDEITPINLLKKLKKASKYCYILESVEHQDRWGRYTFLGFDPLLDFTCIDGLVTIKYTYTGHVKTYKENPIVSLRKFLAEYKSPKIEGLPTFTGGLVGYFGYDFIKYSESKLNLDAEDEEKFRDLDLMLFDKVICFDNLKQKIFIIVNVDTEGDLRSNYDAAKSDVDSIKRLIKTGDKIENSSGRLLSDFKALFNKDQYMSMVEKAKKYIYEGDIFQVVLSNRLEAKMEGSLLDTYRMLRTINPSPYMFYFSGDDVEVAGSSPETLVKLEDGILHTFPLAGTRPRGKSLEEDQALAAGLLKDEKECAEHNMLVDLGRNDLGKISEFGSVAVEEYMQIQYYSHVMHIGSTVRGQIREGKDAIDAISAVLPAGTLSGAPKLRACQIINELENNKRGIYGGAIGYIDFTGNMDTCIGIRLAYKKNDKVFVRSGAGIVADSVPESEYQECINKAMACTKALLASREVES